MAIADYLLCKYVLVPMGYGRPESTEYIEQRYREGEYAFMDTLPELGRYAVIAGYVSQIFDAPTILDLGCGHGRLLQVLRTVPFRSYLGVDISTEAVRRARANAPANARFEVASIEDWIAPQRFDAIIFNESLYYMHHPLETFLRFLDAVNDDGAVIVSIYRRRWARVWKLLEKYCRVLDATAVRNRKRQVWDIKVLQARTPARVPPSSFN
jgi:trans-aconitate methyltransferase